MTTKSAPQHPVAHRAPRKPRFPWARLWVWVGTLVAIGFTVAFVLKVIA